MQRSCSKCQVSGEVWVVGGKMYCRGCRPPPPVPFRVRYPDGKEIGTCFKCMEKIRYYGEEMDAARKHEGRLYCMSCYHKVVPETDLFD